MESIQQPSVFAQVIDKLRTKSEAELKILYLQLSADELANEWKNITQEAEFKDASKEEIVRAIQKNRYRESHV